MLTHGDQGKLYAYDGDYKYEELWSRFYASHCPTLKGKPKIFIVQACQGNLFDEGFTLERNLNVPINNNNTNNNNTDISLNQFLTNKPEEIDYFPYQPVKEHDFLIIFSTQPGNYKNTKNV